MTEFKDVQFFGCILIWIIVIWIAITHIIGQSKIFVRVKVGFADLPPNFFPQNFFSAHILARKRLHRSFNQSFDKQPSVSIIKPLCFPNNTVDDFLEKNLESFFNQKYTNFDINFCVADSKVGFSKSTQPAQRLPHSQYVPSTEPLHQDASIEMVKTLINRYPNIRARLFIGQDILKPNEKRVTNPKLDNIKVAYESSESEYIWMCDSRIIVDDENTLAEMVSHFENENIGLVHSLPVSISKKTNASRKC